MNKPRGIRRPAVAGTFYAGTKAALRGQLEWCYTHPVGPGTLPAVAPAGPRRILGLVCPHAGYVYSGPVAAHGYAALAADGAPQVAVILGPNHYGWGSPLAITHRDFWETPLGRVAIDRELVQKLLRASPFIREDELAHSQEHSIEVQVPFLQHLYADQIRILPIAMLAQDVAVSLELGRALADCLGDLNAIIVASSDFTHYEPHPAARQKDHQALEDIVALDPQGLAATVEQYGLTMCGPGPVMTMLTACRALGAKGARLLRYATSGDTGGDYSRVVGYASVEVFTSN